MKDISPLHPALQLGHIELNVKDMESMKDFYHGTMGLDIIDDTHKTITFGIAKQPLVTLHHTSDLTPAHPGHAGLYHFAIVFASRSDLANMVYRILKQRPQHFSGSADHLVSEAFYFADPEGNGIELYFDRDRSEWQWENKQVKMASLYIDPAEYIRQHIRGDDAYGEVLMGHFHLKVGDIAQARTFYADILGFDVTAELPGALFVSVGGYHHHLGLNVWESMGAPERGSSLGLKRLAFILPDTEALEALRARLTARHIEISEDNGALVFHDPWKNSISASAFSHSST